MKMHGERIIARHRDYLTRQSARIREEESAGLIKHYELLWLQLWSGNGSSLGVNNFEEIL